MFVPPVLIPGRPLVLKAAPGIDDVTEGMNHSRALSSWFNKAGGLWEGHSVSAAVLCACKGGSHPSTEELYACSELVDASIVEGKPPVVLAIGDEAVRRSLGLDSATSWRGSILESSGEIFLGKTTVESNLVYTSGAKKGQPKPQSVEVVAPAFNTQVVVTLSPADVMASGLETLPSVLADITRFLKLGRGETLPSVIPWGNLKLDALDLSILPILAKEKTLSVDVETSGWKDGKNKITMVGMAWEDGAAVFRPSALVMQEMKKWLGNPENTVVGHNFGYDYKCFLEHGIETKAKIIDTMHLAHWHRPFLPKGLGEVASRTPEFHYTSWKQEFASGKMDIFLYNAYDVCWTWQIWKSLTSRVRNERRLDYWHNHINPLVPLVADIELRGVPVDRDVLVELRECQQKTAQILQQKWEEIAPGVNAASPKQLQVLLFEQLGLPRQKKLDKATVATLRAKYPDCEPLKYLTAMRHVGRIVKNYLTLDLSKDGRLHPQYNLSKTRTGRFSGGGGGDEAEGFNFQNIPRSGKKCDKGVEGCQCYRLREMFTGSNGGLMAVGDWSQVEIRLAAWLSGENQLIEAFSKPGFDVYQDVADALKTTRAIAKVVVLGLNYGMQAEKLAQTTAISEKDARLYVDRFSIRYPHMTSWRLELERQVRKNGFVVNPFGRRVYVEPGKSGWADFHKAIAGIPQSTCADMMLQLLHKADKAGLKILLTVHDELGVDAPRGEEDAQLLKRLMEDPFQDLDGFWCPAEVGLGRTWKEAKT